MISSYFQCSVVAFALTAIVVSTANAHIRSGRGYSGSVHNSTSCEDPIADEVQASLLDRHGDDGIDADSNGELTCEEVDTFFQANPPVDHGPGYMHLLCEDPIADEAQASLLEQHGDDGIDIDSNGTLTCEEVVEFLQANSPVMKKHSVPRHHGPCPGTANSGSSIAD